MADSFNVYLKWLGIPLHQQPPNCYRLLGVEPFESDLEVIAHAADRQMAHIRSFSAGEHANLAQRLLNEISAARVQLLHPQKKASYDALLQADLLGLQGQAPAPAPIAQREVAPPAESFEAVEDEQIPPVWRHPAVLATAGICCVMVVAICSALYLRSRAGAESRVAEATTTPATNGSDLSPGELAAVSVDEESSPKSSEQPSPSLEPIDASTATPADGASVSPADGASVPPADEASVPTSSEPSTMPTSAATSETAITAQTPASETTAVAKQDAPTPTSTDSMAFTPSDPGPPEPLDEDRPVVRRREKLPIPASADQARALAQVKDIFSREYAGKSLEQKRALAQVLMNQTRTVEDDAVSRYVLLSESVSHAKEGGDLTFTLRAIDELDRSYVVDALEMKIDLLNDFSRQAKNTAQRQMLADLALNLAQQAARERKYEPAEKLAIQAQSMATRLGNDAQRERARELGVQFKKQRLEWGAIQAAIDKLATAPEDGPANLLYGKFLCLQERDWTAGLEHLARSSDARLSELARRDLAVPANVAEQVALADAWHDLAQSQDDLAGFARREHHWYLAALPGATGLTRTKVERRLRENKLIPFRESWLTSPGDRLFGR